MLLNVDRTTRLLKEAGVDGLVSSTLENNYYLSGVWFLGQELFPLDGEAYVVTTADQPAGGTIACSIGGADEALAANEQVTDVVTWGTFYREYDGNAPLDPDEQRIHQLTQAHDYGSTSIDALVSALTAQGLASATVAVDERGPKADLLGTLAERLPDARFVPAAGLFRRIRSVKTPGEVDRLVATLRVTEQAMRDTFAAITEGVTERELKLVWEKSVIAQGAHPKFCLVKFGRSMALGQIPAGDTTLARGDAIFFDLGCDLEGYKSDIGRIATLGDPDPTLRAQFDAIRAGQQAAIDAMRPGALAKDVFATAVAAVQAAGLPDYRRHHVGHGIGIETYDVPIITPNDDTPLEPGMVFEVETPLYVLGQGGAFIEDTVVIGEDGAQILTELDRDIIVVD